MPIENKGFAFMVQEGVLSCYLGDFSRRAGNVHDRRAGYEFCKCCEREQKYWRFGYRVAGAAVGGEL